ncbi:MAG: thiamine pyrophosphate-binding protein [Candidatus Micrarchaeia archaeon]|jgi:acetolactate synthase-1/2/3 large subunit
MKLSDYVIGFIEGLGATHAFMVVGGGMMHLAESLSRSKKIRYIPMHHEQAAAFAAEGYSRATGIIGVAFCTTGPGGTNMVTGTVSSWVDSIPVLNVSGQASSKKLIGNSGMRQVGVQEADIVSIVRPITKYAVTVANENDIKYHLEKAAYLACNGRPGPVWIDIPLDIQAKEVNPTALRRFDPDAEFPKIRGESDVEESARKIVEILKKSKRPLFIIGQGIRLAGAAKEFVQLAEQLRVPAVVSKNAYDIIPYGSPIQVGMGGINGQRPANFAIQAADSVIVLGCRLSLPFIGYDGDKFAPKAEKVLVDIDKGQLDHATVPAELKINCDVHELVNKLAGMTSGPLSDTSGWLGRCQAWKSRYPGVLADWENLQTCVNSYDFVKYVADNSPDDAFFVTDQGASFYSPTQAMQLRKNQRFFTNGGIAAMGYGLPAAIGACFAINRSLICIHGDGGLQLNIQELQTIIHNKLPVKLFVFNNQGYLSIKHTQMAYFGGHFVGADPSSGLSCPDIIKIAQAYGFKTDRIANSLELREKLGGILKSEGPIVVEVMLDPLQQFIPKVQSEKKPDGTMVSKPLDDMYPYLDRETYANEKDFGE